MNYPGVPGRGLAGGGGATAGMSEQEQAMVKGVSLRPNYGLYKDLADLRSLQMHAAMESCAGKTVISGGMGFLFGGAFGLFMSSVRCTLPSSTPISS